MTNSLAGSKRSKTVLAEAKYDLQSLLEAKIGGLFIPCDIGNYNSLNIGKDQ